MADNLSRTLVIISQDPFLASNVRLCEYPTVRPCVSDGLSVFHFRSTKTATRYIPNEDGNYVGTLLSLQIHLHVSGFQWKTPKHLSGCVVEGRCNSWSSERIRSF